jgi:transcriptional regulator with XRE-family HTH domain
MDIMDTARLNIKKRREMKGLRQQDMADKLNMTTRTYQNLESGTTRLDLERLEQIAGILEMQMEDLLKQEGYYIYQEIKEATGSGSGTGDIYNYGIEKETVKMLLTSKDSEIQSLKEEIKSLKEELKYFKEKVNEFMRIVGK